jgi:uncharacterized lipoprotein YmbA
MRIKGVLGALLCVLFGLVGCFRSPTPRYFTLIPAVAESAPTTPSTQGPHVGLVSLTMPPYLLDPRMSLVAGDAEIVRDEFERWAEDLDENFRRVLLEDLSRELASSNVSAIDVTAARPGTRMLRVEVLRFDTDTDGIARLRIRWSLSTEVLPNSFNISEWSDKIESETTESRVKALSSLVGAFAHEVSTRAKVGA